MHCPRCGALTKVEGAKASAVADGKELRRTRVCEGSQHHRFDTYERAQIGSVRKDSGAIEDFDPGKLERGLLAAINKRPVDRARISAFVDEISAEVAAENILDTKYIGERALALLNELDDVAYIRFLSVYRDFGSLTQFRDELARLRPSLQVHKANGQLQPFDRTKLLNGLLRATNRRPVSYEQVEAVVEDITSQAPAKGVISSADIGQQAMAALRDLDVVAYIRFASVYRNFASVNDFLQALEDLRGDSGPAPQ